MAVPAATLPRADLLALQLPALEAVGKALGWRPAVALMGGLAGLALVTSWNALVFAASRVFRLLARSGVFPDATLSRLGSAGHVGAIALAAGILSFAGRAAVGAMVSFVSLCMTVVFLLVSLALWRAETGPGSRRLLPAIGAIASGALLVLSASELPRSFTDAPAGAVVILISLGAGIPIGLAHRRRRNAAAAWRVALADQPPG